MKRIVTFVVPLAPIDSPQAEEKPRPVFGPAELTVNSVPDHAPASEGTMKVEVVVSDAQANRIINALLEQGGGHEPVIEESQSLTADGDAIDFLVKRELEEAEPDAHDLLDRIVKRVERQLISKVYSDCDYVKSRAATRLGINRNTLLKKLREFGEVTDDAE